MIALTITFAALCLVVSLPYWLPGTVVTLRNWLFTRINGPEAIAVPGPIVGIDSFKELYGNPAARGRSRGAALSDLFWYWLSPGPEMHQEHLEDGERYEEVAHTTRRLLALPKKETVEATARSFARVLDGGTPARFVRLRDLVMPIWADFYHELVFKEPSTPEARKLIVDNANDVVSALKLTRLRHLKTRDRLTRFLISRLEAGCLSDVLPRGFSLSERALYLQGVFFNTAVVQTSEATAHLMLFLAEHPAVQQRLVDHPDDEIYLEHVVNESLRVHPLFGVAHRITSEPIAVGDRTLPAGSVLCFNYQAFHHAGFREPARFRPERWESLHVPEVNFMPFGIPTNRACPAQAIALVTMRAAAREMLRRFRLVSSVGHTRSLPNRAPCLLVARDAGISPRRKWWALLWLSTRDRWEDLARSLVQLVLGTYMVAEARRLKLCRRFFESPSKLEGRGCPFRRFRSGKREVCP